MFVAIIFSDDVFNMIVRVVPKKRKLYLIERWYCDV